MEACDYYRASSNTQHVLKCTNSSRSRHTHLFAHDDTYLNPVKAMYGPSTHADTARMLMKTSTALGGGDATPPPSASSRMPPSAVSSADGAHTPVGPWEQETNNRSRVAFGIGAGGGGDCVSSTAPFVEFLVAVDADR